MKITALIARCLLGFVFLVFGLNGFLHFIPQPPMTGLALQFLMALALSHFMTVVFLLQIIPAILLLINRYVPLALVLLGPVLTNIVLFHAFMAPAGLPLPLILSVLWLLVAYYHRSAFVSLFQSQPSVSAVSALR
jgi:putative oxidoreductase